MSCSENIPEMTTDTTLGEQIGRRLGERIGRMLGQQVGRRIGEWLGRTLDQENQSDGSAGAADSESDNSDDSDTSSSPPETRDELEGMSYRELQTLAKDAGVKANITKEEMIERLADTLNIGSEEQ
jgi:hypothetical protein